ncbi:MAG: GNAT family N-acetyltransferase [Vicinamibacteria bacterium]|nr:GNAT family N-acetyltransferase [Vicinamibacteria bacterium]
MTDFRVRRAEARDVEALGRLGAMLVRAHHAFDADRFMAPEAGIEQGYARFLASQLDDADAVVFVAERTADGTVVGYSYAGLEPRSWKELREAAGFVHDVAVDEAARGQGVATRLLETAAAWLEDRGAARVMLWTAENNALAQRMFERAGFRRTMIEMTRERRG